MATCRMEEVEDLITCSVCFREFNNKKRCPKYLPCLHTLCLQCIQWVTCPLCRLKFKSNERVPLITNNYALYLVCNKPSASGFSNWCLNFGSLPKITCPGLHQTIYINSGLIHKAEEVQKLFNECTTTLANNVEERHAIQSHLRSILKPLETLRNDWMNQIEKNDFQLVKMMSRLETIDLNNSIQGSHLQFLKKCLEEAKEDSQNIIEIASQIAQDSKMLEDFQTKGSLCGKEELLMVSHIIAHFQHNRKVDVQADVSSSQERTKQSVCVMTDNRNGEVPKEKLAAVKGKTLLGQVDILLSSAMKPSFSKEICAHYSHKPTTISQAIKKAVAEKYLTLAIKDPAFQPSAPTCWSQALVQHPFEVGIVLKVGLEGKVNHWVLTFFLSSTPSALNQDSPLFGRIVNGGDTVNQLSCLNIHERKDVNVFVESI